MDRSNNNVPAPFDFSDALLDCFLPSLTAALEELHRPLVPFRLLARVERAQIPALAVFGSIFRE